MRMVSGSTEVFFSYGEQVVHKTTRRKVITHNYLLPETIDKIQGFESELESVIVPLTSVQCNITNGGETVKALTLADALIANGFLIEDNQGALKLVDQEVPWKQLIPNIFKLYEGGNSAGI